MAKKKIFKTAKGYDFKSKDGSRYPLEMENGHKLTSIMIVIRVSQSIPSGNGVIQPMIY